MYGEGGKPGDVGGNGEKGSGGGGGGGGGADDKTTPGGPGKGGLGGAGNSTGGSYGSYLAAAGGGGGGAVILVASGGVTFAGTGEIGNGASVIYGNLTNLGMFPDGMPAEASYAAWLSLSASNYFLSGGAGGGGAGGYGQLLYQPVVTSISPHSGPTTGGTSVTITGSYFTGATAVDFGSVAATQFTVNSDTSITAVSPAGSGVVDVIVVTPGGTSATSLSDRFTYSQPGGGSPQRSAVLRGPSLPRSHAGKGTGAINDPETARLAGLFALLRAPDWLPATPPHVPSGATPPATDSLLHVTSSHKSIVAETAQTAINNLALRQQARDAYFAHFIGEDSQSSPWDGKLVAPL